MRSDPSPVWPSPSHYSLRPKPQFPLKQLGWVSIATVAVLSTKPDRPNMAPRTAAESSLLTPRWNSQSHVDTRNSDRLIEFDGAGSPIGRSPFRPILVER